MHYLSIKIKNNTNKSTPSKLIPFKGNVGKSGSSGKAGERALTSVPEIQTDIKNKL